MPRIHAGPCMKPGDRKTRNLICHECIKSNFMVMSLCEDTKLAKALSNFATFH